MKKMLSIFAIFCCFTFADEFAESSTTLGGYGELHWDMEGEEMDFHRFIFYIKHNFNDQWSMMSEVEIEHNMVYSDGSDDADAGYLAMEQAFLNYWNGTWGFQGGVLLVPAGVTNEYHEPPTFMSVERPEYNKQIIPTTWFDNGFAFYGTLGGVNWKYSMTGDLNGDGIGKGIRSARDKGVSSTTTDWTRTMQLSWAGMEGLKVGGSVTMNDAPVSATHVNGGEAIGVTLTEMNATYSKNNMYARMEYGTIDYENNWLDTTNDGNADYEVESSSGYYLDLGYNVADMVGCDGDLYVWTRTSEYNKDDADAATEISLFGVTFKPIDNIAIKFETGEKDGSDMMKMGLGYNF
tara:strand:+ start:189 stop:1238 length:1050 start_codon:yes stop_codon:yes gene_type:complete